MEKLTSTSRVFLNLTEQIEVKFEEAEQRRDKFDCVVT